MFGGRAESGNAPIQAMVGASHPGYHEDKDRAGSCKGGQPRRQGRRQGWKNWRRRDRESRLGVDDGEELIW